MSQVDGSETNKDSKSDQKEQKARVDLFSSKFVVVVLGTFILFSLVWFLWGSRFFSGESKIDQTKLNSDSINILQDYSNESDFDGSEIRLAKDKNFDVSEDPGSKEWSPEVKVNVQSSLQWLTQQLTVCIDNRDQQQDQNLADLEDFLKVGHIQGDQKYFWSHVFSLNGEKPKRQIQNLHIKDSNGKSLRLHIIPQESNNPLSEEDSYQYLFFTEDEENLPVPVVAPFKVEGMSDDKIIDEFMKLGSLTYEENSYSSSFRFTKDGPVVPVQWNVKNGKLESFQIFYGAISMACQNGCQCL